MTGSPSFEAEGRDWYDPIVHTVPFTNAGVVPLGPVIATGRHDTSLYKYAMPLSHQLCFRNLQGLDLDHEPEVVLAAKGQSRTYGVPRTTLVVSVRRGPGESPPPLPDVNTDTLTPVGN